MNHGDMTIPPLSPEGQRRKEAILATAEQALKGRVRRVKARRAAVAGALLVGCAVIALRWFPNEAPREQAPVIVKQPNPPTAAIQEIARIDDDSLHDELARLGIDVLVAEVDGKVQLLAPDGRPFDRRAIAQRPRDARGTAPNFNGSSG